MHANQVVAGVGEADFLHGIPAGAGRGGGGREAVEEIGQQENNRAAGQDAVQEGERAGDAGAALAGFKEQHLADEAQQVAPSLARGQVEFHPVGEEQQRHLVAAARGGDGQRGGNLGGELAFGAVLRAERRGGGNVHRQHHGQLALLAVALHEGPPHPVGDIPVNVADFVAGDVFAQLFEVHAPAFEVAEVGAHHGIVHEAVGAHLDAADVFEQLREGHGTGTALKIFRMMASVVTAWASAS